MRDSLLLNADHTPLRVVDWERAVVLLLTGRALLVEAYLGREVRSVSVQVPWPAVVALREYVRLHARVRFTRASVLQRDGFACQYCGVQPRSRTGDPDRARLTLDHVVPRARAREGRVTLPWSGRRVWLTSWDNVVTACQPCNGRKADRTPAEAGLSLLSVPRRPSPYEAMRMQLARMRVPDEWSAWLPAEDRRAVQVA